MSLNRNNFLRWSGGLDKPIAGFSVSNRFFTIHSNENSITIDPFNGQSSTYGIDKNSLVFVSFVELNGEITFDGEMITIPRPLDPLITYFGISVHFFDFFKNISPSYTLNITVSPTISNWVSYPPSAYCLLDYFGNQTGKQAWRQLVLQSGGVDVTPLTLKNNEIGDIDYVSPVINTIACPTPTSGALYSNLIISNGTISTDSAGFITITKIILNGTFAGSPTTLAIPCNITCGKSQRFYVPAQTWNPGLTIIYESSGNLLDPSGYSRYFWYSVNSGAINPFPSSGANNIIPTSPFGANSITIPANASGITIKADL